MKKLNHKRRKWFRIRTRRAMRRVARLHNITLLKRRKIPHINIVNAWTDEGIEKILCRNAPYLPPKVICFDRNADQSMLFMDNLRTLLRSDQDLKFEGLNWLKPARKKRGLKRLERYFDFSKVEFMSTAATLVFVAEYDRISSLVCKPPPIIDLDKWDKSLFSKLFEIGFFEVLGLTEKVENRYVTSGNIQSMRIIRGNNASQLNEASNSIINLCRFLKTDEVLSEELLLALNNSISEAMINVARHAYPNGYEFKFKHVSKWWVTASIDRTTRILTIVIYDQGASIPVTFPWKEWRDIVKYYVDKILVQDKKFDFENDGAYISGAMLPQKSQTNQINRGLGLPEMKDLIDICGEGSLSIFSRGGEYRYEFDKSARHISRPYSVGGTLIEWKLRLPEQ